MRAMDWTPPPLGTMASRTVTITDDHLRLFAELTGDHNPLHFDDAFVARTRYGRRIAHGGITAGLFNALVAEEVPGPGSVFLHQEWDYPAPVYVGDTVIAEVTVIESRADKPITRLHCVARRADGTEVLRGESVVYTVQPDPTE